MVPVQTPEGHHWPLVSIGLWAIDHYPLHATTQPLPYPPKSSLIKSISLQFKRRMLYETTSKALQKSR